MALPYIAEEGCAPTYGSEGAAGLDLHAYLPRHPRGISLAASWRIISTGLRVAIPDGHVGLVRGRSGMHFKSEVECFEGTIDSDYRGVINVSLRCLADHVMVLPFDRIAQLVIVPAPRFEPLQAVALTETDRGDRGFGSTGA